MPPPEHRRRYIACPHCGQERETRAHPNTTLRCARCSQRFLVPADAGDDVTVGEPTGGPTAAQDPAPPAPVAFPPPAAGDRVEVIPDPVAFPATDPPPAGAPVTEVGPPPTETPPPAAEPSPPPAAADPPRRTRWPW